MSDHNTEMLDGKYNTLIIRTTAEERLSNGDIVSYGFKIDDKGLAISEHSEFKIDQGYGAGVTIRVPKRIWDMVKLWMVDRIAKMGAEAPSLKP